MAGTRWIRPLAAIGVAASLTLACSAPSTGPGGPAAGGPADRGAALRIGYAGPTQSLDPAKQALPTSQPATFLIYDRLTALDDTFTAQPMLATSWQFAPDGSFLEFKLRGDVTFHDGTPLDAAAVKASLDRNKSLPGSTVAAMLADITSVEVVDPTTVRLHLKAGRGAGLPRVLSSNAGEIISPKALADGRDLASAPGDAGSGPYAVKEFRPNELVVLERAPGNYWDTKAALPKRVEISFVPAASTRINALRAGQLDVAHILGADIATAEKLADSGAFKALKVPVLSQQALYLRSIDPKFADKRVRMAISLGIDRKAISAQLLGGNCEPLVQPFPVGHWAHAPGLEDRLAHDPERARRLLAEAGVTSLSFTLDVAASSAFEQVAQMVQSQLAPLGIKVELTPLPSGESDAAYREGRYPAYLGPVSAVADPSQLIAMSYLGPYGGAEAVRDTVKPLADKAEDPTLSQEQRGDLYRQIWTTVADEATLLNICSTKQMWAYAPKVTGVESMPWTKAGLFDARYLAVTGPGR
ncbi:ABC transporter substrate-binding protein [Streptomyces sp. NBC_00873]|uniref:ABC transporter substrate-binding protein n=1 Tax=unclassified Streptomyces TaxID=2593676 RepID=UPI003863BEA2|nr:ABC transporter substrate-binding protein [Streptomyces sp. NBC_00873]WTA41943.1 ABC transporter substrate-binding protein [Streptomyces sp. NBC_00842]